MLQTSFGANTLSKTRVVLDIVVRERTRQN